MTCEELEAIKRRTEAAMELPWDVEDHGYCLMVLKSGNTLGGKTLKFIEHSKEDVLVLVAEVEKLRRILCRVGESLKERDGAYLPYAIETEEEIREVLGEE